MPMAYSIVVSSATFAAQLVSGRRVKENRIEDHNIIL
jgi:hypothetical protein